MMTKLDIIIKALSYTMYDRALSIWFFGLKVWSVGKDRCRDSGVRGRCGLKEDVETEVERGTWRRFGHLERMSGCRLTKQIYRVSVCDGEVGKGRPRNSMQSILVAY
ncbi:hypothetical protein EVAR_50347_1 [Eumeta japonica]|uniref:Uncharacterized protein n=1 Tax=Eumeta variegata TaxID=151549 RepID=A0A4C1XNW8_EUMVA|nr:hypothetical protein EVAR_50347_1 [Eumeta japonica]